MLSLCTQRGKGTLQWPGTLSALGSTHNECIYGAARVVNYGSISTWVKRDTIINDKLGLQQHGDGFIKQIKLNTTS